MTDAPTHLRRKANHDQHSNDGDPMTGHTWPTTADYAAAFGPTAEQFTRGMYGVEQTDQAMVTAVESCGVPHPAAVRMVEVFTSTGDAEWAVMQAAPAVEHGYDLAVVHDRLARVLESLAPSAQPDDASGSVASIDARHVGAMLTAMRAVHGSGVSEGEAQAKVDSLRGRAIREGAPSADFAQVVAGECLRLQEMAASRPGKGGRR